MQENKEGHEKKEGVEAVDRALAILSAFNGGRKEMTLTEISQATGLYKSTILRLAASLQSGGFLERGADLIYRPGNELWRLGALVPKRIDLGQVIRPALAHLVERTEETASFYILEGDERVCLFRHNSPRAVRHHLEEGTRLPAQQGAAGRVLMAFASGAGSSPIKEKGYAVSLGERDPDVGAIAVPVIDASGKLFGALAVSAILTRFNSEAQERALEALKVQARSLSTLLMR